MISFVFSATKFVFKTLHILFIVYICFPSQEKIEEKSQFSTYSQETELNFLENCIASNCDSVVGRGTGISFAENTFFSFLR